MPPLTTMPESLRLFGLHPKLGRIVEVSFPPDCFRYSTEFSVHLTASSAHLVSCRLFPPFQGSLEHTLTRKQPQIPGWHIHSESEGGAGSLQVSQ